MIVLADTNILLDVLQKRLPHYDHSSRVWNLVEQKVLDGYVSAISFNNVFYVLRKQIGSAKALEAVKLLRAVFKCVPLDEQAIDRAIATTTSDFEDAIQAAAGLRVGAEYIVTRNVQDFRTLGLPPLTAEELLAVLAP
jgi:predicted nucleic acid-binding protein